MRNLILILLVGLSFAGCKKELVEGCTDPNASNYNPRAEKDDFSCTYVSGCTDASASNYNANAYIDDGSCKFSSFLVIWWNNQTRQELVNLGISELKFYIDGEWIATEQTIYYWEDKPSCTNITDNIVQVFVNVSLPKNVDYEILDQNNRVIYDGSKLINKGCNGLELS
jgi:hypothetical protein